MELVQVKLSSNKRDWYVTANGRVLARPETKQDAIDIAHRVAKELGLRVVVHGLDGQIYRGLPIPESKARRFREAVRAVSALDKKPGSATPLRGASASGSTSLLSTTSRPTRRTKVVSSPSTHSPSSRVSRKHA